MNKLMVRMSITDILLIEAIIKNHMKENNIKNIDEVETDVIQKKYDDAIEKLIGKSHDRNK